MLVKGGVTYITRGFGQFVNLEPYLYSEDPDYPDKKYDGKFKRNYFDKLLTIKKLGMEFRWFCKQKSEEWPMDPMLYEGKK